MLSSVGRYFWARNPRTARTQMLCPSWRMPGTSDDQRRFGIFCHLRTRSTVWGVWGDVRVTCRNHAALWDDFTLFYNNLPSQVKVKWRNFDNFDFEIFWQYADVSSHRIFGHFHPASRGSRGSRNPHGNAKTIKNSQQEAQQAQQAAPKCPEPSAPDLWGSSSLDLKTH
jgi:hypothetical protein